MRLFMTCKKIIGFFLLMFLVLSFNACIGNNRKDRLKFPAIVAIDQAKKRIFVIDNQKNGLNVIEAAKNNEVVTKEDKDGDEVGVLTEDDTLLLPEFPSSAAVASLENDLSRIFVIGSNASPLQKIIVLDYDSTNGLKRSELSPINVPGLDTDVLVGIKVDNKRGVVWVSNSGSAQLHGYDVKTGQEIPQSPIALSGEPTHLSLDTQSDLLAVANSESDEVAFIDLSDLNNVPKYLNIGKKSRDVALQSAAQGTLLFASILNENRAQVYHLDLNNLLQSSLIHEVTPSTPSQEDVELVTGNINLVAAGQLSDGRVGGYFTESSGDLLAIRVNANLAQVEVQKVEIGAASGEGIEALLNESGQITDLYFASPGVGTLTVVDPFETELSDQIP